MSKGKVFGERKRIRDDCKQEKKEDLETETGTDEDKSDDTGIYSTFIGFLC